MSDRLTFEFAVKVRKSTIRELQASRRELLVQLAHKTYEPAREKALPGPEVSLLEVSLDKYRQTRLYGVSGPRLPRILGDARYILVTWI